MREVAAIIVNYNMPERTDRLVEWIIQCVRWPVSVFVVDNGSDLVEPSGYTRLWLPRNVQTTGGWLAGLKKVRQAGPWLGYWFLITSAEPAAMDDPLTPMAELLVGDPETVGVHPALTEDSTTAWKHMITRGGDQPRRTWMMDNIASLWRAEFYEEVGGFDPELVYGWGVDLELCWKARQAGRSLWIHEGARVKKVTDIGYAMGRMNMSAEERRIKAGENMAEVLGARYGSEWNWRMRNEGVEEGWR